MPSAFPSRLAAAAKSTDAALGSALSAAGRPARLMGAMQYAALGPGKRLRPFLLIESARLFGKRGAGVVRAAAALECVHCYSLIHDDLPAMDDDDLRRGRPTVHRAYDEATAILAGDGLLTLAFAILANPATHADAAVRSRLVAELAHAAGVDGMVGGQMLDLDAEERAVSSERAIARMQAMKTGALFRFACEAGAIMAGASAKERALLADFGSALGLVFQRADDLIDVRGDAGKAGKATGKDAKRGKATIVGLRGLDRAEAALAKATGEAVALLAPLGPRADILGDAARFAAERSS